MKNALIFGGLAVAAYGIYRLMGNKGCSTGSKITMPSIPKPQLIPNEVRQEFDTRFRSLFPTPQRLGIGALPIHADDPFVNQTIVD